jgi:hypothetical protein
MPQVKAAWIERFASRLIELQPTRTPLDAVRFATSTYPEAPNVEPARAAEHFAHDSGFESPPPRTGSARAAH